MDPSHGKARLNGRHHQKMWRKPSHPITVDSGTRLQRTAPVSAHGPQPQAASGSHTFGSTLTGFADGRIHPVSSQPASVRMDVKTVAVKPHNKPCCKR